VTIDYASLLERQFPEITHSYSWRDSALYALGLGVGSDPVDPRELQFVFEKDLKALPTMPVVLGHPGFWISDPDTGIDFSNVVHGEQSLTIHFPLSAEGTVVARNSIEEIIDRGEGRGALLRVRRDLYDQATGKLQSTQVMSMFCRGDGGFGGPTAGKPQVDIRIPERTPDRSLTRTISSQAALLYRLSADLNPLHADPAAAGRAGFERPILHGLATFGIAGFALLTGCAGGDAAALRDIACRFMAPVFPGETLRTDIWEEGGHALFRSTVIERDKLVLDKGRATFA
jgi:acyl dehydratase